MKLDKINKFGNYVKSLYYKTKFVFKKNGPEILIATGIVSAAAAIVVACVQTSKVEKVLEPANKEIDKIHEDAKWERIDTNEERKQLCKAYAKTGLNLVKLYSPVILLFGSSAVCVLSSHHILKNRELAMAAAYKTIEAAYNNYRSRVKEEVGEDKEYDLFNNIKTECIESEEVSKNGKKKTVTNEVKVYGPNDKDFTILFDESNINWKPDAIFNLEWLMMQERLININFRLKKYMFLDEVYKTLGIEPCVLPDEKRIAARSVGWIYDPEDPTRDNYISFGIADLDGHLTPGAERMRTYGEKNIYLIFNPDGDILNTKKNYSKYANCW